MNFYNIDCDPRTIRNFGKGDCTTMFGSLQYLILVRKGRRFTAAEYGNLMATLLAANTANAYDSRIYRLGEFHTIEPVYSDAATVTRGNRSTVTVGPAVAGWRATMDEGGVCTAIALQSIDGLQDTFGGLFVTVSGSKGYLVGTQYMNYTTNKMELAPVDFSNMSSETPQIFEYENIDRYPFMFQIKDRNQLFVNPMIIGVDIDALVENTPNIQDVMLGQLDDMTSLGVVNVSAVAGCGAMNLANDALSATWANVARWKATNYQTGAVIPITSVAVNASKSGFTFDLDSANVNYPTAGQYVALELVDVQTLSAAGLKYYASLAQNFNGDSTQLLIKILP